MHRWLRLLLASCAISGLFESALFANEPARPNIVFLISDDHAWTDYGCITLLDLCGLKQPEGLSGRSLRPQLSDHKAPGAKPALGFWSNGQRTVRTDRWRLITDEKRERIELFDYETDPDETRNHVEANAAVVAQLMQQLK